MRWTLKRVCEIDWYDLTTDRDREFVEDPNGAPFLILIDKSPEDLASTIKWLLEERVSESFINVIIEAYVNNCESVVIKT